MLGFMFDGKEYFRGDVVSIAYLDTPHKIKTRCSEAEILDITKDYILIRLDDIEGEYTSKVMLDRIEDISLVANRKIDNDMKIISHPDHYQSETGLEAIDVIEAFTFDLKGIEATDTGNILKYMCRWKKKNGLQDLKKAQWYLEHLIKHVETLEKENG